MKIKILSILLLVFFLTACEANPLLNTNAEKVMEVTQQIVDFSIPVGYEPDFTANYKGYTLVSYRPENENSHLYILQSKDSADAENLQGILDVLVPGTSNAEGDQQVLDNYPIIFRGQETNLILLEGKNSEGKVYNQILVDFEGKGGPAVLVFSELSTYWDMDKVNRLLESVQ
ncbi:MAG: hypothetical protein Q7U53_15960 [Anaerolineaceae bacterium]|nr:hypothetical protein [Anaerolineaceae bacterium]